MRSKGRPPATLGNTASLAAVSASPPTDAWAVGHTQVNREDFAPLARHWNGTAQSVSSSAATALAHAELERDRVGHRSQPEREQRLLRLGLGRHDAGVPRSFRRPAPFVEPVEELV
jgi:hypothetical protein